MLSPPSFAASPAGVPSSTSCSSQNSATVHHVDPSAAAASPRRSAMPSVIAAGSSNATGDIAGLRTPDPAASPHTTLSKPRLLWKSSLVLPDGTLLPGVAFASHIDPFKRRSDAALAAMVTSGAADQESLKTQLEAEESLCLALEMTRHRNLRITSMIKDEGTPSLKASESLITSSRGLSRTSSLPQPSFASSQGRRSSSQLDRTVHWRASGEIRVYLDPNQLSTVAFFERHFCLDPDLVAGPPGAPPRTKEIFLLSLEAGSEPNSSVGFDNGDVFAHGGRASNASSTSEFALFGQIIVEPPTTPDPSRRLTYISDDLTSSTYPSTPPRKVLSLVIGRKVVTVRKPSPGPSAQGSFRGRGSLGTTSLNSVFSQAGLSLPQFGIEAASSSGTRPDDPLPRGSIASLLQARALKRTKSAAVASETRDRSSSPFTKPSAPSSQRRVSQSLDVASRDGRHSSRLDAGSQASSLDVPFARSSKLAKSAGERSGSRNNTPGRRGEKRPRKLVAIEETIEEEPNADLAVRAGGSPSKRRGPKADRVQLGGGGSSNSLHSRLLAASRSGRVSSRPSPAPSVKSEVMTPELPSLPLFDTQEVHSSFRSQIESGADPGTPAASSTAAEAGVPAVDSIERSNRSMIKKLVYSVLTSKRGIRKGDDDFAPCYTQAYSGTWCAFRKLGAVERLDKAAVERVVRRHLDMYVDTPGSER